MCEKGEALCWSGVIEFTGLRQRAGLALSGEELQQSVTDECEVSQQMGIAGTGTILAHQSVASPMIAVFDTSPMAANEFEPLFWGVFFGKLAG